MPQVRPQFMAAALTMFCHRTALTVCPSSGSFRGLRGCISPGEPQVQDGQPGRFGEGRRWRCADSALGPQPPPPTPLCPQAPSAQGPQPAHGVILPDGGASLLSGVVPSRAEWPGQRPVAHQILQLLPSWRLPDPRAHAARVGEIPETQATWGHPPPWVLPLLLCSQEKSASPRLTGPRVLSPHFRPGQRGRAWALGAGSAFRPEAARGPAGRRPGWPLPEVRRPRESGSPPPPHPGCRVKPSLHPPHTVPAGSRDARLRLIWRCSRQRESPAFHTELP